MDNTFICTREKPGILLSTALVLLGICATTRDDADAEDRHAAHRTRSLGLGLLRAYTIVVIALLLAKLGSLVLA